MNRRNFLKFLGWCIPASFIFSKDLLLPKAPIYNPSKCCIFVGNTEIVGMTSFKRTFTPAEFPDYLLTFDFDN